MGNLPGWTVLKVGKKLTLGCGIWIWCLGCDVWVQTKNLRLYPCLLFIFVGSLVTVNFRNLDFPLKNTSESLCFVCEPWEIPSDYQACSWPQSKPKSSMAAMGVFRKTALKTPRVRRANFDDPLYSWPARIGVQLVEQRGPVVWDSVV